MRQSPSGTSRGRSHVAPVLCTLAVALGCIGHAYAIEGGAIVAGTGGIQTQRNTTTVNQTSDRMVVNWKNFDIARNQTVDFKQPAATAAVLNRVSGSGKGTEILGSINANGRVFVVNPDGVMFGRTAKVNVGALVASSLDTDANEFMQGGRRVGGNAAPGNPMRYVALEGSAKGAVRNQGKLTASEAVVLAGPQVGTTGTIRAADVALVAGDGVGIVLGSSGFQAAMTRSHANALVENNGAIVATGGVIALSAAASGDALRDVVRNTGTLEATRSVSGTGGSIELQAPMNGSISVAGSVHADGGVHADTTPLAYADGAISLGYDAPLAKKGHDVRVESGARINAAGAVSLATENDTTVNGRIDGDSVWLLGDKVTTQAPIHAASNVNVVARGSFVQNGDIVADKAHVLVRAHDIRQGNGVTTRAGDYITLEAAHTYGGDVQVANLQGKRVSITGHDIALQGDVRAAGNVGVVAIDERDCPELCTAEVRQGSIAQKGSVISREGDVTFNGYSLVHAPGQESIMRSGTLTQAATSKTNAAGDVKIAIGNATVGNIQAGKSIEVNASSTTLNGRLVAPVITLPENALNTEGNVRIRK